MPHVTLWPDKLWGRCLLVCINRLIVSLTAAIFAVLALGQAAHADLLI